MCILFSNRNNPLFTVHADAAEVLKHSVGVNHEVMLLSQRIEERLNDPSAQSGEINLPQSQDFDATQPETDMLICVEDENIAGDGTDIVTVSDSVSRPEMMSTHPYTRRIREICELIVDASHIAKDGRDYDICKSTCDQMMQLHERFVATLADPSGLMTLRSKKFKTLKQLSQTSRTFQCRRIEKVPNRKKRVATKARGDAVAMEEMNRQIKEMTKITKTVESHEQVVERELWGDQFNATDSQMEEAYLNVTGDIYMHELDKLKLKKGT